ncbi:hypothetical protein T11_14719 [Trichinella zimbabwensis]|uniref:Uncharacterized protein n=1 Tax=Trichinella zimbabwensis TaxID=268475 RepID=A0A0V1GD28_9BILA|nr:hypothetical protein T11_14719 [Trichinella zimbabwensis]
MSRSFLNFQIVLIAYPTHLKGFSPQRAQCLAFMQIGAV